MMTSFMRGVAVVALATLGGAAAPASQAPSAPTSPIEGVWLTAAKSQITVTACNGEFCGNITKIVVPDNIYKANKQAIDAIGANQFTDEMNKDPNLRSRPILGLQILTLHKGDKPRIYDGTIYNPQDGNTYSGYVEVLSANKIRLNGCILYNIICKGEDWVRVPAPPPGGPPAPGTAAPAATAPAPSATPAAGSFQ